MKIVVLVKEVPDTYGDRVLNAETGLAERSAGDVVLDEITERALEAALSYRESAEEVEVVALSMSPESAATSVRKALAMGADAAVHIVDEALSGADVTLTAEVLAAALARQSADLIIAGNLSTDGSGGVIPAMLAEHLRLPLLSSLSSIEISADTVSGTRVTDAGTASASASFPAIVSVTEALPEPRFPNFKGIMAAKKKPLDIVTLEDLGVDPMDPAKARSIMTAVAARPAREAGVKIVDEGDGGEKIAEYLVQNRLV